MVTELRWTSADLELMPEDGKRYEIVDGELYVSTQPHWHHQVVCSELTYCLQQWSRQTNTGIATQAPGLIFGESDDVVPDVIWISNQRLETALAPDGKLHAAPELVVEVLSPGSTNERRDREVKLKLYSRRGALEYWIVDWRQRQVEVYRRTNAALSLVETLYEQDELRTPLLPGFACDIRRLFPSTS